jgi:hypothetical protein
MEAYRERLTVPVTWWVALTGLAGSLWLVYQHAYGPVVSVPVAAAALLLGAAALIGYGRVRIAVDGTQLVVGKARLPLWAVGEAVALTDEAARVARGPELDPDAYVVLRGYVDGVVRVRVDDEADPVPYWLMSTRRPARLLAVLEAARDGAGSGR